MPAVEPLRTVATVCFVVLESCKLTPRIGTRRQSLHHVLADVNSGRDARLQRKGGGIGEIGAGRAFRATQPLDRIHRAVGLSDQLVQRQRQLRTSPGDAHAQRHWRMGRVRIGVLERVDEPLTYPLIAPPVGAERQRGEFVAAQAAHDVGAAKSDAQYGTCASQQFIPGPMPGGIVELLEIVDVSVEQRRPLAIARRTSQQLETLSHETATVQHAGQLVAERERRYGVKDLGDGAGAQMTRCASIQQAHHRNEYLIHIGILFLPGRAHQFVWQRSGSHASPRLDANDGVHNSPVTAMIHCRIQ
jgi:hypothetical protein